MSDESPAVVKALRLTAKLPEHRLKRPHTSEFVGCKVDADARGFKM